MSRDKEAFERIYEKSGAAWTRNKPPQELVKLIESGRIRPCKAIDIGCGEGFYSIYLASRGFDVLGIDFSERAVQYARNNASEQGVDVRFMVMDLANLGQLKERFDFVLEWGVMHHIMPPQRPGHVKNIAGLLNRCGKYLSVCFNEQSPEWGGPGKKYRESPIGTRLYYSSQSELKELFETHFRIIKASVITMTGREKENTHTGNRFFMEKQ